MKSSRIHTLAVSIALSSSALAQVDDAELQKKVDFKHPAATAARTLEALGKSTGIKMAVTPQTASEVLLIDVSDVTIAELMKRIAQVTSGEWRPEGGGYRLMRPAYKANQEANTERVERIGRIRATIAKRIEALKAKGGKSDGPEPGSFNPMFGMGGDAEKTITKLLALIDPSTIADLEQGGRIVFSTTPTRMQRPIFGNVAPIIAEYVQAHNASVANRPNDPDRDDEEIQEFMKIFGMDLSQKAVDGRPAKVLLAISRGGGLFSMFGGGIQVEILLYNERGDVVLKGQSMIADGNSIFEGMMESVAEAVAGAGGAAGAPKEPPQKPVFPGPDGEIEFSSTTKDVVGIFGEGGMMNGPMQAPKKLEAELEKVLLRPDMHDPLSFAESDSLVSVAKTKGWDVVANPPDSRLSFIGMFMGANTSKKVNDYLVALKKDTNVKMEIADGWFTVQPAKPVTARKERVDRPSLARLLAAAKAKDLPGLDDYAAYALKNEAPFDTPAATFYLTLFAPNAIAMGSMGLTDWNMIRFYAAMSPTQRLGMKNGMTVGMLNLDPGQKTLLGRILFGSSAQLKVGEPALETEPFFVKIFQSMMGGQSTSWKQEPTEVMPNGLPNDGLVHFSSSESMIGRSDSDDEISSMLGALGPAELALFQIFREDPRMSEMAQGMPTIGALKLGSRVEYRFLFQVARDVSTQRSLNDDTVPKDAKTVTIDQLPESFKKDIAASAEALKKSSFFKMMMMGVSRTERAVPPPPPGS